MVYILDETPSIANHFLQEMRSTTIQHDRLRFRTNLERVGNVLAYEISKKLPYEKNTVNTPLGIADSLAIQPSIVLGTILRAGLPLHQGLLQFFDQADNAFVSAYRKHHKDGSFEIKVEYLSCPDLNDKILILADPMLATGASMVLSLQALLDLGTPQQIHLVTVIASRDGIGYVQRNFPNASIWTIAVDEELTAKSYIVPGLGDAGDLAFGAKLQD